MAASQRHQHGYIQARRRGWGSLILFLQELVLECNCHIGYLRVSAMHKNMLSFVCSQVLSRAAALLATVQMTEEKFSTPKGERENRHLTEDLVLLREKFNKFTKVPELSYS